MGNILIITDNESIFNKLREKTVLIREDDRPVYSDIKNYKKHLSNNIYDLVILEEIIHDVETTNKIIQYIKNNYNNIEIILYCKTESNLTDYYENGISDFIYPENTKEEVLIKILNRYKYINVRNNNQREKIYLQDSGIINSKNNCYNINYIKRIYNELLFSDSKIKNSSLCIVTLEEQNKTKVALNRLAGIINKNIRDTDILSEGPDGLFYIIFENSNIEKSKKIIQKLQDKIGDEVQIRAGITQIGIQEFEDAEKSAIDSLKHAIINNKTSASLSEIYLLKDNWTNEETAPADKYFKLFQNTYENKLKNIIEPTFFKNKKDLQNTLKNTTINYYTNKIECAFSIKGENAHSEIIIHFDGYTKLNIDIIHKGLDTAENSKITLALNRLSEKELNKLIKQLKTEYKQNNN